MPEGRIKRWRGDKEYRFLNPYNFVGFISRERPANHVLGSCPSPPHDRYWGLCGRIHCRVKAVTSLFVSDSHAISGHSNGENKGGEHLSYRFFRYAGRPALPASSLRGMVRSVFEAITNSCLGVFQEDKYPLEYRPSRAPQKMTPARVLSITEQGAELELLDCTRNIPEENRPGNDGKSKTLLNAALMKKAYPPVVYDQHRHSGYDRGQSKLPVGFKDGQRVAALISSRPELHPKKPYCAYHVQQIVPVEKHADLKVDNANLVKVFGWLHLTGPNIENKHDERLCRS